LSQSAVSEQPATSAAAAIRATVDGLMARR
jgi:hypothetical protein